MFYDSTVARALVLFLILTQYTDELWPKPKHRLVPRSSNPPSELAIPAVNIKRNLFAKLHTDQIQLVCKDNTNSFGKEKKKNKKTTPKIYQIPEREKYCIK